MSDRDKIVYANLFTRLRLWWHCLTHWHRSEALYGANGLIIRCYDCEEV